MQRCDRLTIFCDRFLSSSPRNDGRERGLIAQEVEAVIPHAVTTDVGASVTVPKEGGLPPIPGLDDDVAVGADGTPANVEVVRDPKTVRYGEVYTELIGAVQALSREVDALHIQLATMDEMRHDLAEKVRAMEEAARETENSG